MELSIFEFRSLLTRVLFLSVESSLTRIDNVVKVYRQRRTLFNQLLGLKEW